MSRFRCAAGWVAALALAAGAAWAEPDKGLPLTSKKDALRSLDMGLRWLAAQQAEDGHWSLDQYPAITALAVWAFLRDPARKPGDLCETARKGLAFIESCAQPDGAICRVVPKERGGSLRNYNTAICLAALAASGDARYDPIARRAREFLIRNQCRKPGPYQGGLGYDPDLARDYADMNNTHWAMEAIKLTAFVAATQGRSCGPPATSEELRAAREQQKKEGGQDLDWAAAVQFLERCQVRPGGGETHAVSAAPKDQGGFFYRPGRGMAGKAGDTAAGEAWRPHGVASYEGILGFLYADLARDDPRVTDAAGWARRNYTLDEHPGLGQQGLYFYYHAMAKALCAFGEEPLKLADGREAAWREELAVKLVSLQKVDARTGLGYWVNETGRWMENDPVLVTAYTALALETLLGGREP